MTAPASPRDRMHAPCCSAHGIPMTCARYRRTHFVEVRPCCSADAEALMDLVDETLGAEVTRGADLPPYTRKPLTTADGLTVIGWSGSVPPTAPLCKCSHAKGQHYRDRKGRDICGTAACGCATYRPKEDAK